MTNHAEAVTIRPARDAAESWLPVVGFEGLYEVSDLGKVRSLNRTGLNDVVRRRTWRHV